MDDVTVYFLTVAKAAEGLVAALAAARKEGEYDARPLAVVKALRVTQARIGSEIALAVGAARAKELSWELIGDALGVTRQTAHERYREVAAVPARE
jgi:DNA invertase Pin-like site-specific DNA recombinase